MLAIQDAASIVGYLIGGFIGHSEFPFVANSVTKDGFFLSLALIAISNIRRFAWLTLLIVMGHFLLVVSLLAMIIAGETSELGALHVGIKVDPTLFAWLWMAANVVVVVVVTRIYTNAMRARHDVDYLSPYAFGTLSALADILLPPDARQMEPDDVARNVDAYLTDFTAEGKGKIKWALRGMTAYPLLTLRPPFGAMEREQRRAFMEKRFMSEGSWSLGRWWRRNLQLMMGSVCQLVYLGYYSDPDVDASVGYKRFEGRPRAAALLAALPPNPPGLDVEELDEGIDALEADVVIVGSGAAGAILAYEMAAQGKSVIVMERGEHVDPSNFSDQETTMLSHLYSDGAIQLSRDLRFAVLQGMCVGGSTVVNNAVCFDLPQETFDRWNDTQTYDAGLDQTDFYASMAYVRAWLSVNSQAATQFTGAAMAFEAGAGGYGRHDRGREHRRMLRLRLLQHRMQVRQEDVHARHRPTLGPAVRTPVRCGSYRSAGRTGSDSPAVMRRRSSASSGRVAKSRSVQTSASSSPPGPSGRACCFRTAAPGMPEWASTSASTWRRL